MRWESRQQAVKWAIGAVVVSMGILAGCERVADSRTMSQVRSGDYQAAARERDASPAIASIANRFAADEKFYGATNIYSDLVENQIQVAAELWRLNTIAIIAEQLAASSQYLVKQNPQAAIQSINTTVEQVQGANQQTWVPAGTGVEVPTLTALRTQANQLKDQIAEFERTLASMRQKRQAVLTQSNQLRAQSEAAQGEQALTLFRQSSELRKQAADMAVEIENVENQLSPVQHQLAQVEAMAEVTSQFADVMSGHRDMIERSWRGIASQSEQQLNAATTIYTRLERSGGVMAHAAKVSELLVEQDKRAAEYEEELQAAAGFARDAVTHAENALRQAGAVGGRASGGGQLLQAAMDPATARFTQAYMEFSLGSQKGSRATMLETRARTAQSVSQVAKRLNQTVPPGLDPQETQTAVTEASAQAAEALKSSVELFATAAEAGGAPPYTRRGSEIGQMSALHASAVVALVQNDVASAKQYLDEALVIRDRMATAGERLPGLPASLSSGIPSPAAAPQIGVENQ